MSEDNADENKSEESEEPIDSNKTSSYQPSTEEFSEEISDEENDVESENEIMCIIDATKLRQSILANLPKKRKNRLSSNDTDNQCKKNKYNEILKKYNSTEKNHFNSIENNEKEKLYEIEKDLEVCRFDEPNQPLRFKILKMNIPNSTKNILISKLEQYNRMMPGSGEYCKLGNWLNFFSKIPIGKYHNLPVSDRETDIQVYLKTVKDLFDKSIFGHNDTKEQIIRILAQWISNPNSCGYVIGIHGSPGVGKTKLIKTCISKAMNIPLSFISLGGISDSAYLNGHNYTYEGATYGKITESLIKSGVMNPVFLFDELDKVSNTSRGEEIINTLIHITDSVQNDKYTDKYFEEIDLDLSKSLIIFTYNDENLINPILKDRMITIKVPGYNSKEKMSICKDYIIPELLPRYNLKVGDIVFEEKLLQHIIENNQEDGVRNIKNIVNDIISWVNMMKYIPTDNIKIKYPYHVSYDFYIRYCNKYEKPPNMTMCSMYT
jgi:ATP-dependent Lon protease